MKKIDKILIISATYFEIDLIIQNLKNKNWEILTQTKINKSLIVLKKDSIELFFLWTGIGENNVYNKLTSFFKNVEYIFDEFILIGFVGGLKKYLKVGDILEPNIFLCEKFMQQKIVFDNKNKREISLITSLKPLDHNDKKKYSDIDIVDMESFFVIRELETKKIINIFEKIKVFKVVSDTFDFKFPKTFDFSIFREKNFLKKLIYFLFNNKNFIENMKRLKMYFNFLKSKKKLANFVCNYIDMKMTK